MTPLSLAQQKLSGQSERWKEVQAMSFRRHNRGSPILMTFFPCLAAINRWWLGKLMRLHRSSFHTQEAAVSLREIGQAWGTMMAVQNDSNAHKQSNSQVTLPLKRSLRLTGEPLGCQSATRVRRVQPTAKAVQLAGRQLKLKKAQTKSFLLAKSHPLQMSPVSIALCLTASVLLGGEALEESSLEEKRCMKSEGEISMRS